MPRTSNGAGASGWRRAAAEVRVRRLPRAIADVDAIHDYLFERDPSAADRVVDDVTGSIAALADNPYLGRERLDIHPTARSRPVGKYLVLYRVTDVSVDVVRIVHGARDLSVATAAFD